MERLNDLVLTWRRPLAALLVFIAVLAGLSAVRPDDAGRPVVVAARDLPSGTLLTDRDVTSRRLPAAAVPGGSEARTDAVVGTRLAGPVRTGEVLTDRRLLDPRDLTGYPDGGVLTTVRVADPTSIDAVRVGDAVDVVAVDPHGGTPPHVVATGAVVAARPTPDDAQGDAGAALTLVTDAPTAVDLAAASLASPLAVLVLAA